MKNQDFYKPLRRALRTAARLGRNREERRVLLYGSRRLRGLLAEAYAAMKPKPRHKRRDRRKGC